MREVAIFTQNIYAGKSGGPMPDVATANRIEFVSNGEPVPVLRLKPVSQKPATADGALPPAAEQAPPVKASDQAQRDEEKLKGLRKEHFGQPIGGEPKPGQADADVKPLPAETYFSYIPQSKEIRGLIEHFVAEAKGKPLEQLDTPFLYRQFIALNQQAEKEGEENREFLNHIYVVLKGRGIKVEQKKKKGKGLLSVFVDAMAVGGGGGGLFPDIPMPANDFLARIVKQANSLSEPERRNYHEIERYISRVDRLVDDGKVPDEAQAMDVRMRLKEWIKNAQETEQRKGSLYLNIELSEKEKKDMRAALEAMAAEADSKKRDSAVIDRIFNRMFRETDIAPLELFEKTFRGKGEMEEKELKDFLLGEAVRDHRFAQIITQLLEKYDYEMKVRSQMHNAYFAVETSAEVKEFTDFAQRISSQEIDQVFKDAPEVETAARIREYVLYKIKKENNGHIYSKHVSYNPNKPDGSGNEMEERTKAILEQYNKDGMFGEELEPWQIQRAMVLSRGWGMVSLRLPEIVAECSLPDTPDTWDSQTSPPWQKLIWVLNPHGLVQQYQIGVEMRAMLYYNQKNPVHKHTRQELQDALMNDFFSTLMQGDDWDRPVDNKSLFKIGGPFTSGWRSWNAAVDEHGRKKPALAMSPGLVVKSQWNKYELSNLMGEQIIARDGKVIMGKKAWEKQMLIEHPDWPAYKLGKEWTATKKTYMAKGAHTEMVPEDNWKDADINEWKKAIKRIPHVIFRIVTERDYKLMSADQRDAILQEIFGMNPTGEAFQKIFAQTEDDLNLAKEHMMKRRRDLLKEGKPFTEAADQLTKEDFDMIKGADAVLRQERAKRFLDVFYAKFNADTALHFKIFDNIKNKRMPYAVTTEDIPFGEYNWIETGGRGFIGRRISDMADDAQAQLEVINLLKHIRQYHTPEQIVEQLLKIYNPAEIDDIYGAREAIVTIARGLIRIYQKDAITKLPFVGDIFGAVNWMRGTGNSFAQGVYGSQAMSWDEADIYNFTEHLRMILSKDQVDALRKDAKSQWYRAIAAKSKTAFSLLFWVFLYEFAEEVVNEK